VEVACPPQPLAGIPISRDDARMSDFGKSWIREAAWREELGRASGVYLPTQPSRAQHLNCVCARGRVHVWVGSGEGWYGGPGAGWCGGLSGSRRRPLAVGCSSAIHCAPAASAFSCPASLTLSHAEAGVGILAVPSLTGSAEHAVQGGAAHEGARHEVDILRCHAAQGGSGLGWVAPPAIGAAVRHWWHALQHGG